MPKMLPMSKLVKLSCTPVAVMVTVWPPMVAVGVMVTSAAPAPKLSTENVSRSARTRVITLFIVFPPNKFPENQVLSS